LPTNDRFSLNNKRIVLTGAAGILGRAFAAGLRDAGASLFLVDRDSDELGVFCKELAAGAGPDQRIGYLAADLSDRENDRSIFGAADDVFGAPADGLVNNAATKGADLAAFFEADENYAPAVWREIMGVNLEAPFFLSAAFAARLKSSGLPGNIVNISSIYGHMAPDQRIYEGSHYLGRKISGPAVYSASKAGVIGLTRHLAALWGAAGIRVNSLAPGGVGSGQNGVFAENYSRRVPLGRMAERDDIVGGLIFLMSDASSYVTGQNWLIDGGLSAW
jgi:NAD(P)-dependent dehydrogenase (short-subunit alcohol dehydrogenase family)